MPSLNRVKGSVANATDGAAPNNPANPFGLKTSARVANVDKKKTKRNDRIVAIENDNHSFAHVKHIDDLGKPFLRELEEFFVNYHRLSDEEFRILGAKGPSAARKAVDKARKQAR